MADRPTPSGAEEPNTEGLLKEGQPLGDLLREIAQGVRSNSTKLDHLEQEQGQTNQRLGRLEQEQGKIIEKLGHFEQEQGKIIEKLGHFEQEQGKIIEKLGHFEQEQGKIIEKLGHFEQEQEKTNLVVETYQKASGQVVNLAFGLIATATITLILSTVLEK